MIMVLPISLEKAKVLRARMCIPLITLVVGDPRPQEHEVACINSVDKDFALCVCDKDWEELNTGPRQLRRGWNRQVPNSLGNTRKTEVLQKVNVPTPARLS